MSAIGLRARVVAAAAAAIVVAVVLLGLAVPALLERQLSGALDDALQARAVDVARLASATPDLLTQAGALEGRLTGGSLYVQVLDRRGRLVARSSALGSRLLPAGAATRTALRARQGAFANELLGTEPIRLFAAPLGELGASPAAGGAVIVAGTTADTRETLARTRRLVLLCALAAAALAALLATLLTRRALRPLRRLSSGARAITTTADASERLPVPATRDEVGELAQTLNAMLASLERARENEQRFVADASHELRTPLTALRGNAAYVARHGADPAALADIEAGAARLATLLDDLLALAREDAAAPARGEEVDLPALVAEVAALDANTEVVVEPGAENASVRGEPLALERAVGNLLRNAREHGPAAGQITVTVGAFGAVGDDRVHITVQDEGTGLSDEEAAHAFERFWRSPHARGAGSGLGLAIVRSIAERHGGWASASGACFTIELPALRDLSRSRPTTPSSPLSDDEGSPK
ncbi:MAG: two-component system, OmpR family, sensor kinase [Solirubrobacteraceae bacterium]|nr:two-component system, OmpR family, sensor kinase [Solirubrobacteraceae bacterium]